MAGVEKPAAPADYPARITQQLRFADTDMLGHVNNAVFATLCESGRVAFLCDPASSLAPDGSHFVIARLAIDFLHELNWPGTVTVGTGVTRLGRSSFDLAQGLFRDETCVATAASVIVLVDGRTRKSMPLPEATRAALEALRAATGTSNGPT